MKERGMGPRNAPGEGSVLREGLVPQIPGEILLKLRPPKGPWILAACGSLEGGPPSVSRLPSRQEQPRD